MRMINERLNAHTQRVEGNLHVSLAIMSTEGVAPQVPPLFVIDSCPSTVVISCRHRRRWHAFESCMVGTTKENPTLTQTKEEEASCIHASTTHRETRR